MTDAERQDLAGRLIREIRSQSSWVHRARIGLGPLMEAYVMMRVSDSDIAELEAVLAAVKGSQS